jgi:hypothetical protein
MLAIAAGIVLGFIGFLIANRLRSTPRKRLTGLVEVVMVPLAFYAAVALVAMAVIGIIGGSRSVSPTHPNATSASAQPVSGNLWQSGAE